MYFGYQTHDIDEAIKLYEKRTGHKPTAIVARPNWKLNREDALVFRSRFGSGSGLLVTHLISIEELKRRETIQTQFPGMKNNGTSDHEKYDRVPKNSIGRPKQDGGECPHCGNQITNFERLGHWHGWALGILPNYWDALRFYVFRRDKYTCQQCQQRLTPDKLRCHHVIAKEIGGSDSARNLITLCGGCHIDEHPIFPEESD